MEDHLDSLLKRRRVVQSFLKARKRSSEKCSRESHGEIDGSNSIHSRDIIEGSDTESPPKRVKKRRTDNVTINSSGDSDLHTSTISVSRSNTSFFGDNVGDIIPPNSPLKRATHKDKTTKINIISIEVIKPASSSDATPQAAFSPPPDEPASLQITYPAASSSDATPQAAFSLPPNEPASLQITYPAASSSDATPQAAFSLPPDEPASLQITYPAASFSDATTQAAFSLPPDELASLQITYPAASSSTITTADISPDNDLKTQYMSASNGKRKASLFKKSLFVEFLSEDDFLEFSAGSSDEWTCNESEISNSPKKKKKKPSKKPNKTQDSIDKRKKEKPVNKRKQRKQLKDSGKSYETKVGRLVNEKTMGQNPCVSGKCKRSCFDISEEKRKSLFNFFWSLQRQKDWLVNCSRLVPVTRTRTTHESRRSLTYDYYINDGEDRRKVCQKFLLDTLNITQKFLLYTLSHSKEGMSQNDLRTRHISSKYSPEDKEYVKMFIEKLPAVPSHYTRKRTNRVYLPQELKNLTNLYRIYQKECENNTKQAVGESVFRTIFNTEYNISFHTPKKDKCLTCTRAERNENIMSDADKMNLENNCNEKKFMYKRFSTHQKMKSLTNDTLTTSFDLQKVLTTPHGDSMLLGYARKYAVFNFTLYESGTQNGYCYVWGECDGKRGSQEIATCLHKYFQEVDNRDVKHLILYCDSCVGQNKNKIVLSVINYFLKQSKHIETIQINFLLPGHTYMPVDSMHATIEREIQKLTVWSPSQWQPYICSARKRPRPYQVNILEHGDFINWEELAQKTFTKETLKRMKFQQIRIATFKKKNIDKVEIRYSMCEDVLTETFTLCDAAFSKKKGKKPQNTELKGKKGFKERRKKTILFKNHKNWF